VRWPSGLSARNADRQQSPYGYALVCAPRQQIGHSWLAHVARTRVHSFASSSAERLTDHLPFALCVPEDIAETDIRGTDGECGHRAGILCDQSNAVLKRPSCQPKPRRDSGNNPPIRPAGTRKGHQTEIEAALSATLGPR